jgi:cell division protein FtsI/penicillin-binding protein 2
MPLFRRIAIVALVCLGTLYATATQQSHSELQQAVTRAMAGQRGASIVLDVSSGQLLASYHLEVAARRLVYPGSSIKPFTLRALLEAGELDDRSALLCKRPLTIAGRKLDCTHPEVHQPLDPATALAYSCNSYFTTAALRLTPAQLRNSLVRDGFGAMTSLAPSEATGETLLAGTPQQQQLQAIGEWGIKVTPLELAGGYRRLAAAAAKHDRKFDPLFDGLEQSVTYGMGRMAQPTAPLKVAGKTGTTPAEEGPWTHAWFAGYAPADNPQIVVLVFLEKGHGGSEAAVVAREIFGAYAKHESSRIAAMRKGPQ